MKRSVAIFFALSVWAGGAVSGPFEDGVAAYNRKDYAAASALFKPLAEQGNAPAQYSLGLMYRNGRGVPKDDQQAVFWYRKAADQGNADAQYNLGITGSGLGVPG